MQPFFNHASLNVHSFTIIETLDFEPLFCVKCPFLAACEPKKTKNTGFPQPSLAWSCQGTDSESHGEVGPERAEEESLTHDELVSVLVFLLME